MLLAFSPHACLCPGFPFMMPVGQLGIQSYLHKLYLKDPLVTQKHVQLELWHRDFGGARLNPWYTSPSDEAGSRGLAAESSNGSWQWDAAGCGWKTVAPASFSCHSPDVKPTSKIGQEGKQILETLTLRQHQAEKGED